jgi:hypothetical protein
LHINFKCHIFETYSITLKFTSEDITTDLGLKSVLTYFGGHYAPVDTIVSIHSKVLEEKEPLTDNQKAAYYHEQQLQEEEYYYTYGC